MEQMPPEGWIIDDYSEQWSVNQSSNAGGNSPEARFHYIGEEDTSRLISPAMDISGYEYITVSFRHMYDDYSGEGPAVGLATRSGGGDWHSVWEIIPNDNSGPDLIVVDVDNEDVGQDDFQICFYVQGNFWNLDDWFIDDIEVFKAVNLDAGLITITTPSFVDEFPVEITGSFVNNGSYQINTIDINWQTGNDDIFTSSFDSLLLDQNDIYNFTCNDLFDYPSGSYEVTVWLSNVNGSNDEDPNNDELVKVISMPSHSIQNKPCFEEFTSSTSDASATYNASFLPWCEENETEITYVTYPLDWPMGGDPYYNDDCGERRNYYGAGWLPWTSCDGNYVAGIDGLQPALDLFLNEPGLAAIISSFSLQNTTITVNTTLLPFATFSGFTVHMIVFENETTGNTGTNGETQFKHVMMKMLPDAFGTSVTLEDKIPHMLTESFDLSSSNIEEFDDLGVLVLLQDDETKNIYQSNYSIENGSFSNSAFLTNLKILNIEVDNFSAETYEYDFVLPMDFTGIPEISAYPEDENAIVIISDDIEIPGTASIEVIAEDLITKSTYTINFQLAATGSAITSNHRLTIYPNPSSGQFYLAGVTYRKLDVFDISGSLIFTTEKNLTGSLDLSFLENGIYFIKIATIEGHHFSEKIRIIK